MSAMKKTIWAEQPDLDAKLKELWKQKWSASQMALELNEQFNTKLTRSAVIGRLHRLNLRHLKKKKPKPKPKQKPVKFVVRVIPPPDQPPPRPPPAPIYSELPQTDPVSLVDLNDGMCHYMVDGGYCGRDNLARSSYCPHHHSIMHVKVYKAEAAHKRSKFSY